MTKKKKKLAPDPEGQVTVFQAAQVLGVLNTMSIIALNAIAEGRKEEGPISQVEAALIELEHHLLDEQHKKEARRKRRRRKARRG